jgi:uncharacterized protein YggE
MTQSQTLRTLGAGALGALVVAIAALSVHTGPVSGAPTTDTPATHTITVSATGKVTVVPDVARIYLGVTVSKPTVKAAREAGARHRRQGHQDDQPQPLPAVFEQLAGEGRRLPDQ